MRRAVAAALVRSNLKPKMSWVTSSMAQSQSRSHNRPGSSRFAQSCIERPLLGAFTYLLCHIVLIQGEQANPKHHGLRLRSPLLEVGICPKIQSSHRAAEVMTPKVGHKAMNEETKWIHKFRERCRSTCLCNSPSMVLFTSGTSAWLRHGGDDKGVHGIQVGALFEFLPLLNGFTVLCVEGVTLSAQPPSLDKQTFQMLQLPQSHAAQGVRNSS